MRLLSALLLPLLLVGCDSGADGPRELAEVNAAGAVDATADDLLAAKAAWEASGIADYEMRYERYCFCVGDVFQVRVEGGRIVEAWVDGEPAPEDPVGERLTVDRLLEIGIDAFERADRASAEVLLGAAPYLVSISADYSFEVADEEVGYRVVGFERLD